MAAIKPRRNFIYAYEPLDGDPDVQTLIDGPTEQYVPTTQGIEAYDGAVAWAVSMADQMASRITILTALEGAS